MAQATKLSQMHVSDSSASQLCRQVFSIELRVVSRSGDTAYIDDPLDPVCVQKLQEIFPWAVRMPNGQNNWHFGAGLPNDEYTFPANPLQVSKVEIRIANSSFCPKPPVKVSNYAKGAIAELSRARMRASC